MTPPSYAITTSEFWSITDVDGNEVPLNTEAWDITTFGGSRYSLPPLRGDDQEFAYAPGKEHHAKYADSRTISLVMWTVGKKPDGTFTNSQVQQWNDNYHKIRQLVWRPFGGEITLTRRWSLTNADGVVEMQVARAQAQVTNTVEATMTGRTRAEFSIDLLLANPYFYMDEVEVTVPLNTPITVYNPGDDVVSFKNFTIDFVGVTGNAMINPKLTNSTTNPDTWFRYERAIPDVPHGLLANTVTFDIEDYQIIPWYFNIGFVVHSGSRRWFQLMPGNNSVTLTADGGTAGSAVLRFRPPVV